MPRRPPLALVLLGAVFLAGCAGQQPAAAPVTPSAPIGSAQSSVSPSSSASAIPDPAAVGANELGVVPVLMYHQLKPHPRDVYDITPAQFRAELNRLATEGYVPVTAAAYATGRMDIPAGKHPVVLTFDDSTRSQLTLDSADQPVAGTAVAILQEVAVAHPGFTATATFYVNRDPFAEPGGRRSLGWLHDHGYEIGNHTIDHVPLRNLPAAQVRNQLAADAAMITRAVPGVTVDTMALPLGMRPKDHRLMMAGEAGGTAYRNVAAFLVGAGPAPSPYSRLFDPTGVPRLRSQGRTGQDARFASSLTLDRLAATPSLRYTSDGDPATIAFPKAEQARLSPARAAAARPY
ncbi:MAG: hypothetical protein QOJ90_2020 [Actinomycetota bacterium]|jgi:peptidoglycan/xylan/chitin deacetylase (PgdA/CDA1 family)|nr:hypothetical protein [Actinomycetota bacterium]MDQ1642669.1 hypothetical protein [Actinomycetota bacterium]